MEITRNIKGFQELSLMEWRGLVSSIIFLGGCNFRCFYCHNYEMAIHPNDIPSICFEDIIKVIDNRKGWIDGVVVSGGEPTIYGDELLDFLSLFKKRGLKTKVYTNGYNFEVIEKMLNQRLVDEISLDIKHEPSKYLEVIKVELLDLEKRITETIKLLKKSSISREFRLTLVKGIHSFENIKKIVDIISPDRIILQNVNSDLVREEEKDIAIPFPEEEIKQLEKKL